jgi:hypothetical protein
MDELSGVDCSSANETGTMIRLMLRPGADPDRVAKEADRALRKKTGDRVGIILQGEPAAAALRGEEWRDRSQIAESLAAAARSPRSRALMVTLFWALLLAGLADGLLILWLLRRDRQQVQPL